MENIFSKSIKPISGSWFSIYWRDGRHQLWNEACIHYTDEQWDLLIKEMAELGQKYIVLTNVAMNGYSVYQSSLYPQYPMNSADPLEAVMTAADKYGVKVFMSNDYWREESYFHVDEMFTAENIRGRFTIMHELAERYSHHESFYGWYGAWEAHLSPYFEDYFIRYINETNREARLLTPKAKFLTAPYGTSFAVCDQKFLKQLEQLDVDIIAYQDTVGCFATDVDGSRKAFEVLRQAHDLVPERALWADVETFDWAGPANVANTPLIPAKFERLIAQLDAVSPFVDNVLVFIFQGLFSKPDSPTFTGYEEAGKYYTEYVNWLQKTHPEVIRQL